MSDFRLKLITLGLAVLAGCSGGSGGEHTGQSCQVAADCYPGVNQSSLGQVTCLANVAGGYCTHTCQTDSDCCAVAGECRTGLPQLCAPFESTGANYCFLSCEATVFDAGIADTTAYCQQYASSSFTCRSTGGGSANRKVCMP